MRCRNALLAGDITVVSLEFGVPDSAGLVVTEQVFNLNGSRQAARGRGRASPTNPLIQATGASAVGRLRLS
jgi:hypothetical protein